MASKHFIASWYNTRRFPSVLRGGTRIQVSCTRVLFSSPVPCAAVPAPDSAYSLRRQIGCAMRVKRRGVAKRQSDGVNAKGKY
eukprot:2251471-Rhodomonas_salina.4